MAETVDRHLERMAVLGEADRRNGCYRRWLLSELGVIELAVSRTRTFSALQDGPGLRPPGARRRPA